MSREIKFRAVSVNSGEMVFGSYVTDDKDYHAIVYPCIEDDSMMRNDPIDIKTLGQLTGVNSFDKDTLYAGDVVIPIVETLGDERTHLNKGVIAFMEGSWMVVNEKDEVATALWHEAEQWAALGNIHQNGGLIK